MTTTTTKNKTQATTTEIILPETLYGKYVASKKKLVLRPDLPENATKIWKKLTPAQTESVYDLLEDQENYAYALDRLSEDKRAQFGSKSKIREDVRKAAGL